MLFGEMFASGMALYPSDPADPRYSEFQFEHAWRWLTGAFDGGYFDLPMGYPVPNMIAHSEPLLSFAPFYWLFRVVGLPSSISHPSWLALIAAVNFAAFFLLMHRRFRVDRFAASAAAFLFAFGLARAAQIGHSQLWPAFYLVVVVGGLHALLAESASPRARAWGAPVVVIGMALQAWGCMYNAVFFAYVCLVTALFAMAHPTWRPRAWRAVLATRPLGIACALLALASLWPLWNAYLPVADNTAAWNPREAYALQPRLGSLLYVRPASWYYTWMTTHTALGRLPALHEQALGIGLLTSGVVAYTIARNWRKAGVQLFGVLVAVLLVPAIVWPGGQTLWSDWNGRLPGLDALRATSRMGALLLIPASVALGVFAQRRLDAKRPKIWVAVVLLCVLEQGSRTPTFDNRPYEQVVARIAEHVDPNADAFFYIGAGRVPSWFSQIDGLLASQRSGVPTVNMYSSRTPDGFETLMHNSVARNPRMLRGVERDLAGWLALHEIESDRVQRIVQYQIFSAPRESEPPR